MNDHLFIDIKGSEPDPKEGIIREIAAIRTDGNGNVLCAFNQEDMKAGDIDIAISGMRSVVLDKRSPKLVLVSHYGEYSRTMLLLACKSAGLPDPFDGRVWIDTAQLAWPLMFAETIPSRDLRALAKYYAIGTHGIDTAKGDADITREVYWLMMDRFSLAQKVEGGIRRAGGNVLGKILTGINQR